MPFYIGEEQLLGRPAYPSELDLKKFIAELLLRLSYEGMTWDSLNSAIKSNRDLTCQTSEQFADLIYQYWVASEQREKVMTSAYNMNHDKAFWHIMNHMQDMFVKVPYSSQFFLSVQKRDFSKKIAILIRESPEWKERLSYRIFFR